MWCKLKLVSTKYKADSHLWFADFREEGGCYGNNNTFCSTSINVSDSESKKTSNMIIYGMEKRVN